MKKLCCITNIASHYRQDIYLQMKDRLGCFFVFGNSMPGDSSIKQMDLDALKGSYQTVENKRFIRKPFVWQKGSLAFLKKDFDAYILLGDPHFVSTWAFMFLAKFYPGKETYYWTHGWYGNESFAKRIVKKLFFKLADGIFTYGDYARELMIKEGFAGDKIFALHNSLSYDTQLEIRKSLKPTGVYEGHFQNRNRNLIFSGRLTKVKKLGMIVDAMAKLAKAELPLNLTLVGDGSEMESLKAKAEQLGLGKNVWFYGPCYDECELSKLIYNADICVSPGNVGLTAIHALSYGCPVITHDNFAMQMPEFEAVKQGETGAFFKYDNADSLAETIRTWLENSKSREEIREKCFQEIDGFWNPYYQMSVLKRALYPNGGF